MTPPIFRCDRCGAGLETVTLMAWGEPEPIYVMGQDCNCPGPRCPCCNRRLEDGRCSATLDCPVAGQIIPVPVVA